MTTRAGSPHSVHVVDPARWRAPRQRLTPAHLLSPPTAPVTTPIDLLLPAGDADDDVGIDVDAGVAAPARGDDRSPA